MTKLGRKKSQRKNFFVLAFLLLFTAINVAYSATPNANSTVRGKVVNEAGEPIVGAVVTLKENKSVGTTTDINGNFELAADKNITELNVKYIGCAAQDVKVSDGQDNVGTISMKQDAYSLNDVVVIGYGETSRQKLVGSVAKVKGDVIATHTEDAPILALQGNAAGVFIEQGSGVPGGANSSIIIRGYNALTTNRYNNMPLYIIDGVTLAHDDQNPVSYRKEGIMESTDPLSLLNPNDIESIEILKDADATAIYGTRGANGVVLITTKKGKTGKVKINFSADATAQWMTKRLDYCSLDEYLALRKEAIDSDINNGYLTTKGVKYLSEKNVNVANFPDLYLWDQTTDSDWQGALMGGTAWAKNVQLNVSGGSKNTTFMVSGAYYRSSTITDNDDSYTRWTGSANIQHHTADNRFRIEAGVNITNLIEAPNTTICSYANLNTAPNRPVYDEQGNPYYIPGNTSDTSPMRGRAYHGNTDCTSLLANGTVSYNIWDKLTAKVKMAYAFTGSHQNCNYGDYYANPYKTENYAYSFYTSLNTKTVNVEPQITWVHDFFGGKTTFLLGATYEYATSKSVYMKVTDFADEIFQRDAASGATTSLHRNPEYQTKSVSWFGRINYDYKNRYIANVVLRNDGSSRFGQGHRWGTFFSLGGAWLFTNEKFFKDSKTSKWLSFGKLRMSFGKTGNDNVGNFEWLTTYSTSSALYNGQLGLIYDNVGDDNLHWETVHKFDVGLELGFLKDRLLFSANFYCNTSSDLLKSNKISSQVGYSSYTTNIDAEIRNTGWEFELNAKILDQKNWKWNTNLNMTLPKTKLIKYTGLESSAYASTYIIGESIDLVRKYIYVGINPENGLPLFRTADGGVTETPTTNDKVVLGDTDPDMYGGFNNTIKYKNFTLDISFYFRVKPYQNGYWSSFYYPAGMMYNVLSDYAQNHWSPENPNAQYPGITTQSDSKLYTSMRSYLSNSDYAMSTGSYIKLSNVKLTYNLPKSLLRRVRVDNASVYVQGKNLFMITGYDSYSPETGTGYVPPLTSFSFGLNIGL